MVNEPTNPVVADLLAAGRRELNQHRVTDLHKPTPATPPTASAPRDLVAEARAFATPPLGETRTQHSPLVGARGMIHRLADEIEQLNADLADRDELRRTHDHLVGSYAIAIADKKTALTTLDRIREALAGHPRCDVHPDDDVTTCGWRRAVASVQSVLDTIEANDGD